MGKAEERDNHSAISGKRKLDLVGCVSAIPFFPPLQQRLLPKGVSLNDLSSFTEQEAPLWACYSFPGAPSEAFLSGWADSVGS